MKFRMSPCFAIVIEPENGQEEGILRRLKQNRDAGVSFTTEMSPLNFPTDRTTLIISFEKK